MRIWIDLANSPHILFFKPIISELERQGNIVYVTHRDFAQTTKLCGIYGIDSKCIGSHAGQGIAKKVFNILNRAIKLFAYAKGKRIDLAVSHNSYAHCIASEMIRTRYITLMDYEYQPANHINFRLADRILVPFTFDVEEIKKYGATNRKVIKYPGLKEEVYLWGFIRDGRFWQSEFPDLDSNKIMCTIRPPATMAAYHDFENPIFYDLIKYLLKMTNIQTVMFPRTPAQREKLKNVFPKLYMPQQSVNGAQLIANSDLIISAGGTMNREASVLNTPAYSVYAGEIGSVDKYLIKENKITLINCKDDFQKILFQKKTQGDIKVKRKVFDFIIEQILRDANIHR
ncbi:MAG: DUF354 domain-containing protein [Desulfobacteraceae bacterium]|nr:DUF354 domain-containing protein [Desulfobacteraceae bacterium]MBC2718825.1 DUF354 domain-containing protein [Desulfobacteraceae bacterium]